MSHLSDKQAPLMVVLVFIKHIDIEIFPSQPPQEGLDMVRKKVIMTDDPRHHKKED